MGEPPSVINNDLPIAHLFKLEEVEELDEIAQFLQEGIPPDGLSEKRNKI